MINPFMGRIGLVNPKADPSPNGIANGIQSWSGHKQSSQAFATALADGEKRMKLVTQNVGISRMFED
jgi:hypothetical protein